MAAVANLARSLNHVWVSPQSVGARLAKNTLWSIGGSVASQGSSLVTGFLLGRLLGVTHFGQLALIQATVLLLGNFGEMGFSLTTTKFVSRWRSLDAERTGRLMGWSLRITGTSGLVVAVLLVALEPYFGLSGLSRELRAGCGLLIFDMLNRIQFGALAGLEAFDSTARVQVARGALTLPCVWLGAAWGGLLGAVLAMGFVSMATFAIGHWVLRRACRSLSIPIRYRGALEHGVLTTSVSLWISTLLLYGSTWAVTMLLSHRPSGFTELGLFNAADKWKTALGFLPQMLFQVILPMLSHRHAAGDRRGCVRIVIAALGCTIVVTGLGAVFVSVFSRFFMSSYGDAFKAGASVLSLAAFGALASAIYTVGAGVLWALGKPSQMVGVDIFKTSVLLGLCWGGLAGSAWSVALAYLLSFTAGSIVILLAVRRQLGMQHE